MEFSDQSDADHAFHRLVVEDVNGFGVEMLPTRHTSSSDWHGIPQHSNTFGPEEASSGLGLLPGSSLVYAAAHVEERFMPDGSLYRAGVQTATFTWIP